MTQKTINCAECGEEYTFEENPKYPRKYCANCSAKKKASFEGGDQVPVVKITTSEEFKRVTNGLKPKKDNGFHLTPEQVNTNTMDFVLRMGYSDLKDPNFPVVFEVVRRYILTGE